MSHTNDDVDDSLTTRFKALWELHGMKLIDDQLENDAKLERVVFNELEALEPKHQKVNAALLTELREIYCSELELRCHKKTIADRHNFSLCMQDAYSGAVVSSQGGYHHSLDRQINASNPIYRAALDAKAADALTVHSREILNNSNRVFQNYLAQQLKSKSITNPKKVEEYCENFTHEAEKKTEKLEKIKNKRDKLIEQLTQPVKKASHKAVLTKELQALYQQEMTTTQEVAILKATSNFYHHMSNSYRSNVSIFNSRYKTWLQSIASEAAPNYQKRLGSAFCNSQFSVNEKQQNYFTPDFDVQSLFDNARFDAQQAELVAEQERIDKQLVETGSARDFIFKKIDDWFSEQKMQIAFRIYQSKLEPELDQLMLLVQAGNLKQLKREFDKLTPEVRNHTVNRSYLGCCLLHVACEYGYVDMAKYLHSLGASPYMTDVHGKTAHDYAKTSACYNQIFANQTFSLKKALFCCMASHQTTLPSSIDAKPLVKRAMQQQKGGSHDFSEKPSVPGQTAQKTQSIH